MTPGARYAAAIAVLDIWLAGEPVEKTLSNWARKNRYAGSKDRAAVRDIVFDCLRCLRSYGQALGEMSGRSLAAGHALGCALDPTDIFSGDGYAPSALSDAEKALLANRNKAMSFADLPDWLHDVLSTDLGPDFEQTVKALSERAPVDLRVNLAKTDAGTMAARLAAQDIATHPVSGVETALRVVTNPRRIANSQEYKSGKIELQDAASQAVVAMLDIAAEQSVLDYCAGGGGKTLAMAALQPKAKYSAWDINPARLAPLTDRAKRAGAKVRLLNRQPNQPQFDLVLVDAPCSGSGSWRRNPEGKWRLTTDRLAELHTMQADVLVNAARCVRPGGRLVYATCSVFSSENQAQVDRFLASDAAFSATDIKSFPVSNPGDGFFCAILHKQL